MRRLGCSPESACCSRLDPSDTREHRHSVGGFVLTDAVLAQLKKDSSAGCLLCSLESWDDEDWDDAESEE